MDGYIGEKDYVDIDKINDNSFYNISVENNSFLFLNDHKNEYFEKLSKKLSNKKNINIQDIFFTNQNIDLIQKQLILSIYKNSNKKYVIPYQNNNSILIVMKYIFNEQARHLPYNIKQQITTLNNYVVNELTPMIIKNIDAKEKYLNDINSPPPLNDLPINVNNKGNKSLPSIFIQ